MAQAEASGTASMLAEAGMRELPESRGESAYVWESGDSYWATVVEGLGTKNLVADAMRELTGLTYYDAIAKDTVAAIINDLITVGARPLVVNAYFGVGDSAWMADEERARDLAGGWAAACREAGATWGGGETPALSGIIDPGTIDLAGSAIGVVSPKDRLVLGDDLRAGDAIVLIGSSGIHANGLSLARQIAASVQGGYGARLPSGASYGESLLRPAHIYARFVEQVFAAGVKPHYLVNITGHGWRKLMRATLEFTYNIERLPARDELFDFLLEYSGLTLRDMYATFNMGAGFAVYVPESDVGKVIQAAQQCSLTALDAGRVEAGPKQVMLKPLGITYSADELEVR